MMQKKPLELFVIYMRGRLRQPTEAGLSSQLAAHTFGFVADFA